MLCPNCKTENDDSANFCVNCRTSLKETATPAASAAEAVAPTAEPVAPAAPAATTSSASTEKPNFFAVMLAGVLKPMTTFKENLSKFADFKNAAIIGLIVAGAATILSTITTVVGIVRTEECVENCSAYSSLFSSSKEKKEKKMETKWKWDNLNEFDWFKTVGQTFLMNMFILVALSGAYFGTAKLFKSEKANFGRMLTVVSVGMIPTIIVSFIAPMIGAINVTFAGILNIAAVVYSLSIILVALNEESGLEGDKKVYLNIISFAIVAIAFYVLYRILYGELADMMFKGLFSLSGGSLTGGVSTSSSSLDLDSLTKYL